MTEQRDRWIRSWDRASGKPRLGGDPEPHLTSPLLVLACCLLRLVAGRCESRCGRCRCGVELAMPPPPSTYLPFNRPGHLPFPRLNIYRQPARKEGPFRFALAVGRGAAAWRLGGWLLPTGGPPAWSPAHTRPVVARRRPPPKQPVSDDGLVG